MTQFILIALVIILNKKIKVKKQFLVNSAFHKLFNVSVGDKALHCLPANYIAGKMMLIRAMILGFEIDLISPSMPFHKNDKSYDFVAMTPTQAFHSLNNYTIKKAYYRWCLCF